ncbi:MAG: type VI secretion system ImpA family N-terminal domain-containing protein, partial [Rhodobacteraceae bacterium]|nr:type VI secretion system ImpA family N-terminal domain-containing protein [Paracoccaceae bacterium]
MKLDDLLKPVSPDAPCGEDLLAVDEPEFVDYYFNVDDRFPSSYFKLATGTLFDPKSVDHRGETAQIDALLKQTRDLRLVGIEAKFQILAGRFKGWAEAVQGMIALVRTWPDDIHPRDPVERQNALEEL